MTDRINPTRTLARCDYDAHTHTIYCNESYIARIPVLRPDLQERTVHGTHATIDKIHTGTYDGLVHTTQPVFYVPLGTPRRALFRVTWGTYT